MREFRRNARELALWGLLFLLAFICLLSLLGIAGVMILGRSDVDFFIIGYGGLAFLCWLSWRGVKRVLGALAS